jgi:hypothetical protein
VKRLHVVVVSALAAVVAACGEAPMEPVPVDEALAPNALLFGSVVTVTNNQDAGAGSFRAAVEAANANPSIGFIRFRNGIGVVALAQSIVYTGAQSLHIDGHGAVVDATSTPFGANAFVATGGGDLSFESITFQNASGNGVFVNVPANATGKLSVHLRDVVIRNNGLHGLHVDDQVNAVDNTGADSDASIGLDFASSSILDNGFRADVFDFDGIRIVDEGDDGDVRAIITTSTANRNGDEGFDLNENGVGSIFAVLTFLSASDNSDEGVKFSEDELDAVSGGIEALLSNVVASRNAGDGLHIEEFGAGDVGFRVLLSAFDNNDDGIDGEQELPGTGVLRLLGVSTVGNADEAIELDDIIQQ